MTSPNNRVLIIGAGLGGLTLAQSLRKLGVTYLVLERDASPMPAAKAGPSEPAGSSSCFSQVSSHPTNPTCSTCADYVLGHEECLALQSLCFVDGTTGSMMQKDAKKFENVLEFRASEGLACYRRRYKWGKSMTAFTEEERE
ncbi:hypothetical protein B0H10DRAFT_1127877 [Mycena sp. CBHHK59/15]|nr:hypothetical protein B0H10DRAFT_1127877 [Mycena sp. CBHHK59/15]